MANIKQQKKRIKTNEGRRVRGQAVRSSLRTSGRKFREAVEGGDKEAAKVVLQKASRDLDKAASKGVIHKNNAANKKSAMARRLNSTP